MMNFRALFIATVILTSFVGCQKTSSRSVSTAPNADPVDSKSSTSEPAWDAAQAPVTGTTLTVSPNPADFCTDAMQVVQVQWDMTAANPTGLQIWIEDSKGNHKLWVAPSTRQGTKNTGPWISAGSRIVAVDSATNRVLNAVTIVGAPCSEAAGT